MNLSFFQEFRSIDSNRFSAAAHRGGDKVYKEKELMNMERALRRDRIFAPVLVLVTVELANSSDSSASKETIPWQIRR